MSRYRSILLFAAAVTAFAACGPNNSTSSVTTGKSTASASISPQPVAAPSTSAAPMIPAPSGSGAYPTHPLRFKSGQATVTAHMEGTPNAALEAQHFGCVPVLTDVGGARETVEAGVTGLLCDKDDVNV